MVMMTQHLPRSQDGLPMEWSEVPFGPLFPGLPGGLVFTLTLDGDTTMSARVDSDLMRRDLIPTWLGPLSGFPDRVSQLDPLTPEVYRTLAAHAVEAAGGPTSGNAHGYQRVIALERERISSHLNWLSRFGSLLGHDWLATRAVWLYRRLRTTAGEAAIRETRQPLRQFVDRVVGLAPLRWRLQDVGRLTGPDGERARGPVARALGLREDARNDDAIYRQLGFTPVVFDGSDAWARLCVRLREIEQSLDLVLEATARIETGADALPPSTAGAGAAQVETPRGRATMQVTLSERDVRHVELDPPSAHNLTLVDAVAREQEVGDALAGVASLDLSPWELDQ